MTYKRKNAFSAYLKGVPDGLERCSEDARARYGNGAPEASSQVRPEMQKS